MDKFEQKLDEIELNVRHAEQAFQWMQNNGRNDKSNVLYYDICPQVFSVVRHRGVDYYSKQAAMLAYIFAQGEKNFGSSGKLRTQPKVVADENALGWAWYNYDQVWEKLGLQDSVRYSADSYKDSEKEFYRHTASLLHQFNQIILYGPPGTGKTHTTHRLLAELLGSQKVVALAQGERWDIVQFHPSYNYEDFVRGVQVKTNNGQVVYAAENRIFGEMCARAADDPSNNYALIIDEINRANVSAVLGELIYALEYRGKAVKTPYTVQRGNAKIRNIVVPKNLYIIGTMNTADRTIGQIDYAVRRRFAFVHCPPKPGVIDDDKAREFFDKINALFDNPQYMSPDFDADDLRIGHSYFLTDPSDLMEDFEDKIANKIIYQVVPILREYVRDSVLLPGAETVINDIEESVKELLADVDDEEETRGGKQYFYWHNGDRHGIGGVGRTAFGIIKDFIEQHPDMNVDELNSAVTVMDRKNVFLPDSLPNESRYFAKDPVHVGERVFYVSNQWGAPEKGAELWNAFKEKMSAHGYSIGLCHLVNLQDGESRKWKYCHRFNFVSARGKNYRTPIKYIKENDLLFVNLVGDDLPDDKKGYIICGRVVSTAEYVGDFQTPRHGPLAQCDVGDGRTYKDAFSHVFQGADDLESEYAVGVEWLCEPLQEPITLEAPGQFRRGEIKKGTMRELRPAFNLQGFDK